MAIEGAYVGPFVSIWILDYVPQYINRRFRLDGDSGSHAMRVNEFDELFGTSLLV